MQKFHKIFEKFKQSSKTSQEFKMNLFNNFFGDIDKSFQNEEHIEFTSSFCFDSLLNYKNTEKFNLLNKKFKSETVAYCIIMKDRPFITDSILSWIKSESLYPSIFIHPNFFFNHNTLESSSNYKEGFQRYSIVYFEISEPLTIEQENSLKEILEEVYLATENYAKMKQWLLKHGDANHKDAEVNEFIKWMCDEAFVMLGIATEDIKMGVCALEKYQRYTVPQPKWLFSDVVITKSLMISSVHRRDPVDIVLIKHGNSTIRVYGIFTTHSYRCKLLDIPIVRTKVQEITKYADFQDVNYNRKELFSFLENLPREELFSTSTEFLSDVSIKYIESMTRGRTFVYGRQSTVFPLITFAVFTPHTKFTITLFKKVTTILREYFKKEDITRTFSNTHSIGRVVMSFFVNTEGSLMTDKQMQELDDKIIEVCENSEDGLFEELKAYSSLKPSKIMKKYEGALNPGYVAAHNSKEIARDIFHMEQLIDEKPCIVFVVSHVDNDISLKIYAKIQNSLHKIVSILEQFGIIVFSENPFAINNENVSAFVHDISGTLKVKTTINLADDAEFTNTFECTLEKALMDQIPHTTLNRLAITSQTKARDIYLVRTYVKYLTQMQFQFQEEIVHDVLVKYPNMFQKILKYFYVKFDPSLITDRNDAIKKIDEEISELYSQIIDITDDTVVRQIYKLMQATVRTNFFLNKEYVSLKFDCKSVPFLPKPVPFREIFVYSINFEAVHLRFGKVARGGLRWSDRPNDFRTEILGLVKAQNTKNAVIVPVGSKGGFVITKDVSNLSRDEYLKFGQECYKSFLSGCLDLCDNIIQGKVKTHEGIVKWEDEDPYFVVAADKGTATFSDIANSISAKYNFWLGDAFASGGSNGYDHKKMGITAKGGWIAVRRHMMEIGYDIQTQDFTCIGIGDMSGDVFGNGMLLSKHTCLIAAFNHMHIFIDPNPDAEKSFAERKRLFDLPRSTWANYDKNLLSKGGMIYERSAKVCKLTSEIKERFEITQDEISPNELIVFILKAKCDLLWNGGIGTYVKAIDEKHADVGDKGNNAIRINGGDLRCKVVGEGGNLGFTQKGRIEYAQNGGKINTDAMDNSAGVNCSDVEVNIKIVLNKLVDEGTVSLQQRNILLEEMTLEVERLVLRNNYLQTQAITLTSYNQSIKIDSQETLMKKLEVHANLDRENELLPTTGEMQSRKTQQNYLTRPELCVLFAYSKIYLYQELLKSSLIEEKYFENDLLNYFPQQMQEKYKGDILNHKLAREIIATSVNNSVINRVGITFVNNLMDDLQCKSCDVVRAYIVVREIFNLREIWQLIEYLDFKVNYYIQTELFANLNQFLYKSIRLLLNKSFTKLQVTEMIENIMPCVKIAQDFISTNSSLTDVKSKEDGLTAKGIPGDVAFEIAKVMEVMQLFQLILGNDNDQSLAKYLKLYYQLTDQTSLIKIAELVQGISAEDTLEKIAIRELEEKLYNKYCALVIRVSTISENYDECILNWKKDNQKQLEHFQSLVSDVLCAKKQSFPLVSMIIDKMDIL